MLRHPELGMFRGKGVSGPPEGGDIRRKDIGRRGARGQGCSGCQGRGTHLV